jgi:hypothetical protein
MDTGRDISIRLVILMDMTTISDLYNIVVVYTVQLIREVTKAVVAVDVKILNVERITAEQ